jgi:CHAT domain-containing protein
MAFLSACQTATGDEKVPDEAVHLAAGMLAAGYRGVIATMWSVMDQDAPQVARDVYGHLFRDKCESPPDPTEAAYALNQAVNKLRDHLGKTDNASFLSWVPFIHMGI